jgi:non-homologous end joining protein Ku
MIPGTGEEIEKREVVKGYEFSRGQFLTFTARGAEGARCRKLKGDRFGEVRAA